MLGRFLQTDPVGYEDQFNLYTYVANDPLNKTDPTGRQEAPCGESCLYTLSQKESRSQDDVDASLAAQRKGSEAGAVVLGAEVVAVVVGLADGPEPGPVDAVAQTTVLSVFKKMLMDTVSSTAIDVGLNGASSALAPPSSAIPDVEVPGVEVGADPLAGTTAEVGVAPELEDEQRRHDRSPDRDQPKPRGKRGFVAELVRGLLELGGGGGGKN